jgi:hypothetical protein
MTVRILEGADQEAAMALHADEYLPVACLGATLGLEYAGGIAKAEAEPLIDVGHPARERLAGLRRRRQGETGEKDGK